MKRLLFILLLSVSAIAAAEPHPRKLQTMCGSAEEMQITVDKYEETLVMASMAPDKKTVNILWVNFETQTSSWFIHDLDNDEYCMIGVGVDVLIPKNSPLNIGTGKRVKYK